MITTIKTLAITYDCPTETLLIYIPMSVLARVSLAKVKFDDVTIDEQSGMHYFSLKLPTDYAAKIYGALHVLFEASRSATQLLAYEKGVWQINQKLVDFFNKLDRRGLHSLPYAAIAMSQAMKPADTVSSFSLRFGGAFFARVGDTELRITEALDVLDEDKETCPEWHVLTLSDAPSVAEKLAVIVGLASACSSYYED